jgi:peptidyl-prolyl cis-trans isomerase D
MMRQLRENTKWIMLVTAIAFVGLMVFEWGMDITGQTGGGMGELGRVNGTPVSYEQFQAAYRNLYDQVSRSQDMPITSAQNREIEEAAWDEVVSQILIEQELARRGIRVTDREIRDAARFSPPPEFSSDPFFQTDGVFDIQKYQDFLARSADELLLLQLEAYYREIIPRSKLLRQVTSGIYFTDSELWNQYRFENERVRVRFVGMNPAQRVPDEAVQITDAEIRDYYRANQRSFETPAQVEVRYVMLTKEPLQEDTLAARERAEELREEILQGASFADVARRESADQGSASEGGDLGTFARGQMVPAFDSVVFTAPLGRVLEPVQTAFGFHLMEVLSRQGDTASARHILIPVERTNESELRLLTLADSLEALGRSMALEQAARALSIPVQQQMMSEAFPFLAGVGQIFDGLDWAFQEAAPGEVSPVFEEEQAFYMMELVSSTPAGVQSLDNARPTIEQILRMRRMLDLARSEALDLLEEARTAGTLEILEDRNGLVVQEVGPSTRGDFFPGLGFQNRAVGAAFGLGEGEMGGPVTTENNVFLIQVLERQPADSLSWEEQKEFQRAQTVFMVQQQRLGQWIEGLREAANIVDRRDQVLRAPSEPPRGLPMLF